MSTLAGSGENPGDNGSAATATFRAPLNAILGSDVRRQAELGTTLSSMIEVFGDERSPLAVTTFAWPTGSAANQPSTIEIPLGRYVPSKQVRLCFVRPPKLDGYKRTNVELKSVKIEAACQLPA